MSLERVESDVSEALVVSGSAISAPASDSKLNSSDTTADQDAEKSVEKPICDDRIGAIVQAVRDLVGLLWSKPTVVQFNPKRIGLILEMDATAVETLQSFFKSNAHFYTPPANPFKILIVEDDNLTRVLLKQIFGRDLSYELFEAKNGRVAWNLLEGGLVPDLCIMDVMMPELSGLQVLEKIRRDERFQQLEVIMCTCMNDRETVMRAATMQVDYIVKPFSPEVVREKVRSALGRIREKKATRSNAIRVFCDQTAAKSAEIRKDLVMGKPGEAGAKVRQFRDAVKAIGDRTVERLLTVLEASVMLVDIKGAVETLETLERETVRVRQETAAALGEDTAGGGAVSAQDELRLLQSLGNNGSNVP